MLRLSLPGRALRSPSFPTTSPRSLKTWEQAKREEEIQRRGEAHQQNEDFIEDPRGWLKETELLDEDQVDEPEQAWFQIDYRSLDRMLKHAVLPGPHQTSGEAYCYIEVTDDAVSVSTADSDGSIRAEHNFSGGWFRNLELARDFSVGMWVNVEDMRGYLDIVKSEEEWQSPLVLVALCGPEDSDEASVLYLTNGRLAAGMYAPEGQDGHTDLPGWLAEE